MHFFSAFFLRKPHDRSILPFERNAVWMSFTLFVASSRANRALADQFKFWDLANVLQSCLQS